MSIRFYCPNCDAPIAFDSRHSGKRARCTTCGQLFIIPAKDNETPGKIEPKIEKGEPLPGFYHAVFIDTWKIFFDLDNITTLTFVIAAVCFKFFLSGSMCCLGFISFIIVWGWLLGFYLNIIYETAFGLDKLPEIYLGTSITFLWQVIKPFLVFFCTLAAVQLPFIIALILLKDKGITYENMWSIKSGQAITLQLLFILGLFLFPMTVLTIQIGGDVTMLRPDYIFTPIFKAFGPYLVTVALLFAAGIMETQTHQFDPGRFGKIPLALNAANLALNLAVQPIAIIAMRSIGLFYRHYNCHFRW